MEIEKINYSEIGLKVGLEIHQQLDTDKLFCNCPSLLRKDDPDYTFQRKLHIVAGESGKIDQAAKHEMQQDRNFIYQAYKDNNCLVDLDEEPPHKINKNSLKISLQIAILLNCKILPITQIMRKTVIDGSNTGGFQRTVLIAYDGFVETSQGKVKIESIALEEDASRIINKSKNETIYRIDRLGIPLIEITTAPDIKNPEQAKETALHIGNIIRSCKVKRGLGTIRQDVNVSIKKGNRVEIKGFQNIDSIINTINYEIKRQQELVNKNKKIKSEVRKVLPDFKTEFLRPMPGAARMYPETDLPLLKLSRELINEVKKNLPKLISEIEKELKKEGLSQEMIKLLFKHNKIQEFKELLKIINKPQLIAKIFLIYPKEIASKNNKTFEEVFELLEDYFQSILKAIEKNNLSESNIKETIEKLVKGIKFEEAIKFEKIEINEVNEKILKIIKNKPGLRTNAYMGLVMKEFKGKISGKEAIELIQKHVK